MTVDPSSTEIRLASPLDYDPYILLQFGLTNAPKNFQMQLSGTGTANMLLNPANLVVSATANGSFIGGGLFDQVVLNWASTSAVSLTNANNVRSFSVSIFVHVLSIAILDIPPTEVAQHYGHLHTDISTDHHSPVALRNSPMQFALLKSLMG